MKGFGAYSVWLRHAKVFQKTWLVNCLPSMSEPIVYLIAFGYGMSPFVRELSYNGANVSYLSFIAPGMIAVAVLFQSFFEGSYGTFVRISYQKTWQALLTAPLDYRDVFLGDWLWAATRGTIAGILTGLVGVVWGILPLSVLIASLPIILAGSMLFGALGMCSAGISKRIDHLNIPVFVLVVPMFALCGTYFPRDGLPPILYAVASFLPLSALADLLRWHIASPLNIGLALLSIVLWWALFFGAAWALIRRKVVH